MTQAAVTSQAHIDSKGDSGHALLLLLQVFYHREKELRSLVLVYGHTTLKAPGLI